MWRAHMHEIQPPTRFQAQDSFAASLLIKQLKRLRKVSWRVRTEGWQKQACT